MTAKSRDRRRLRPHGSERWLPPSGRCPSRHSKGCSARSREGVSGRSRVFAFTRAVPEAILANRLRNTDPKGGCSVPSGDRGVRRDFDVPAQDGTLGACPWTKTPGRPESKHRSASSRRETRNARFPRGQPRWRSKSSETWVRVVELVLVASVGRTHLGSTRCTALRGGWSSILATRLPSAVDAVVARCRRERVCEGHAVGSQPHAVIQPSRK